MKPLRAQTSKGALSVAALIVLSTIILGFAVDADAAHSRGTHTEFAAPTKVLAIVIENHSYAQMKAGMPYLFGLAQQFGYANNWSAIAHPSEPNYLALVGGSTFGVTNDNNPSANRSKVGNAKSVFDQALNEGKTAKTYAEAMPGPCFATNLKLYAVRHNPWAYFASSAERCQSFDVPMGSFNADAANNALPNTGLLIPNLCNDSHTGGCPLKNAGSLTLADAFLRAHLPGVLASSDYTSGRLTVVVTADEGQSSDPSNSVLTVVLNAALSGKVVSGPLNHYSLTGYYAHVLGVAPLLSGQDAPDMAAAFGL